MMWKQSVWSSVIASQLASSNLKDGGLLVLTGAKAALEGTPGTHMYPYTFNTYTYTLICTCIYTYTYNILIHMCI